MIRIQGPSETAPRHLVCPDCGEREHFDLRWVGDLSQTVVYNPQDGSRDFHDSHGNEGEELSVDESIGCRRCGRIVAERDVLVTVGPWQQR